MPRPLLPAILAEAVRRFGHRPAYVDASGVLTYAALEARSAALAGALHRRGVLEGDVVALRLPTGTGYPSCYLAAARLGAVTAGVNSRLTAAEQERLVELVEPRLVVDETVLTELEAAGTDPPAEPPADPERPVAVVFTSGTTGLPKGAVFAERQLAAIRDIDTGSAWGQGGRSLFATSLSHLGFMTKLAGSIQSGATAHLVPRWRADEALRATAELGLTAISGVPTQLALMLASPVLDEVELTTVRTVVIGGGPATPDLVRAARARFGVPVTTRYSCTEAGIGCGTHPGDPPEDAETTVGRPQPGVELRIAGDGEVQLRSAAVMSEYWRNPVATAQALTDDGFVRTGDLGWVDELGRLHLSGRRTEMWVRGGYNVFPAEVESVLAGHPSVEAVAVVPRDDDVMGQVGVAVVVPRGAAPTLNDLCGHAAATLAQHKLPADLVVVDALPLTAGDKVDRRALLELISRR